MKRIIFFKSVLTALLLMLPALSVSARADDGSWDDLENPIYYVQAYCYDCSYIPDDVGQAYDADEVDYGRLLTSPDVSSIFKARGSSGNPRLSQGQINIVRRARQLHEIEWTPIYDVLQWDRMGVFEAGVPVKGIPYGQPVDFGYVPQNVSFSEFLSATSDPESIFYKEYSRFNKIAPYYSCDCSSFVSWAWGLDKRYGTGHIPGFSTYIGKDPGMLEIGDALNRASLTSGHVVLVADIRYDDQGNIAAIDIIEQTPPKTRYSVYGLGGEYTLSDFMSKYLYNGFSIYRYKNRDGVEYVHDCAVPIDGDFCVLCEKSADPLDPIDTASDWARESILSAIEKGFVPDSLQGNYKNNTTRAELCALAVALYESIKGEITGRTAFNDTSDVNVEKAAFIGVVNGVGNGAFAPNANLNREQAAAMLSRLADATGGPLSKQEPSFNDKSAISSWAMEAAGQMQATGIMTGVGNNTFAPKDPYTREQSIATIMRLYYVIK